MPLPQVLPAILARMLPGIPTGGLRNSPQRRADRARRRGGAGLRALALGLCCALAAPATGQQGHFTAAPDAAQLAAADVLLVDIRQPQEWLQTGVLPQALLIAHDGDHARFLAQLAPHLDGRPVALICRTGNRTAQAAAALAPALRVPVIDIAGGMVRLMAEGIPTVAPTRARGCAVC